MALFPFRRRAGPAATYRLPDGVRVYAIGDVHGRADLLIGMEARIANDLDRHPPAGGAQVIFLGDYVDRGPGSAIVLDRLTGGRFAGLDARFLLGNHEEAMLYFLADPVAGAPWLEWGGLATLASYGVSAPASRDPSTLRQLAGDLGEAMPTRHLTFLGDLELMIELGSFVFVHAGIRPGVSLERQLRDDLLWIRQPFLDDGRLGSHRVVHGHTIADEVELLPNRIGVDTGAFATDRLSAVVIEGEDVTVLD